MTAYESALFKQNMACAELLLPSDKSSTINVSAAVQKQYNSHYDPVGDTTNRQLVDLLDEQKRDFPDTAGYKLDEDLASKQSNSSKPTELGTPTELDLTATGTTFDPSFLYDPIEHKLLNGSIFDTEKKQTEQLLGDQLPNINASEMVDEKSSAEANNNKCSDQAGKISNDMRISTVSNSDQGTQTEEVLINEGFKETERYRDDVQNKACGQYATGILVEKKDVEQGTQTDVSIFEMYCEIEKLRSEIPIATCIESKNNDFVRLETSEKGTQTEELMEKANEIVKHPTKIGIQTNTESKIQKNVFEQSTQTKGSIYGYHISTCIDHAEIGIQTSTESETKEYNMEQEGRKYKKEECSNEIDLAKNLDTFMDRNKEKCHQEVPLEDDIQSKYDDEQKRVTVQSVQPNMIQTRRVSIGTQTDHSDLYPALKFLDNNKIHVSRDLIQNNDFTNDGKSLCKLQKHVPLRICPELNDDRVLLALNVFDNKQKLTSGGMSLTKENINNEEDFLPELDKLNNDLTIIPQRLNLNKNLKKGSVIGKYDDLPDLLLHENEQNLGQESLGLKKYIRNESATNENSVLPELLQRKTDQILDVKNLKMDVTKEKKNNEKYNNVLPALKELNNEQVPPQKMENNHSKNVNTEVVLLPALMKLNDKKILAESKMNQNIEMTIENENCEIRDPTVLMKLGNEQILTQDEMNLNPNITKENKRRGSVIFPSSKVREQTVMQENINLQKKTDNENGICEHGVFTPLNVLDNDLAFDKSPRGMTLLKDMFKDSGVDDINSDDKETKDFNDDLGDDDNVFLDRSIFDSSPQWKRIKHQRWAEQLESIHYIWNDIDSEEHSRESNEVGVSKNPQRRSSTATGFDHCPDPEALLSLGSVINQECDANGSSKQRVRATDPKRRSQSISDSRDLIARKRFVKGHLLQRRSDESVCKRYSDVMERYSSKARRNRTTGNSFSTNNMARNFQRLQLDKPKQSQLNQNGGFTNNKSRNSKIIECEEYLGSNVKHLKQHKLEKKSKITEDSPQRICKVRPVAVLKPIPSITTSGERNHQNKNINSDSKQEHSRSRDSNYSTGLISHQDAVNLSDIAQAQWERLHRSERTKSASRMGRNLIQEYVRIFETRRLITMQVQRYI